MSGGIGLTARKALMDQLLGNTAPSITATYYVALFASGTEISTSGTAYARLARTNNKTNFSNADSSGAVSNAVAFTFAGPATADWTNITEVRLMSAASNGACVASAFPTQFTLTSTGTLSFDPGALVFTLAGVAD